MLESIGQGYFNKVSQTKTNITIKSRAFSGAVKNRVLFLQENRRWMVTKAIAAKYKYLSVIEAVGDRWDLVGCSV